MKLALLVFVGVLCLGALWLQYAPGTSTPSLDSIGPSSAQTQAPDRGRSLESAAEAPSEPTAPEHASPREPVQFEEDPVPVEQTAAETQWGRLDLTVLAKDTGKPLPGLYIEAVATPGDEEAEVQVIRDGHFETNARGAVSIDLLANQPLLVQVMAIGVGGPLATLELEPLLPDDVRELEVRIDGAQVPRFWVQVFDALTDLPLRQSAVFEVDAYGRGLHTAGPLDAAKWLARDPLVRPDADGLAAIPISPFTQKRFAVVAEGYGPVFFIQRRRASRPELAFSVKLHRAASLNVQVVDMAGDSLSSVSVRLDADFADLTGVGDEDSAGMIFGRHGLLRTTDMAGRAAFDGVSSGAELRASILLPGEGKNWQVVSPSILPFKPGEQRELTLVARPTTEVSGTAFDQNGLPAAGVELILLRDTGKWGGYLTFHSSGAAEQTVVVADDGHFGLGEVPAGQWILAPKTLRNHNRKLYGTDPIELEGLFAPVPTRFELTGENNSHSLALELWRDLYVHGVVVNEQGEPQPSTFVFAVLENEGGGQAEETDEDGAFAFGPLPAVSLSVKAMPSGSFLAAREVDAHAGDEGVTVVVYQGGGLTLLTESALTGENIACRFSAWRIDEAGTVLEKKGRGARDAEIEWDGLTAGTWHVLAQGPASLIAFQGQIVVNAGEFTDPVLLPLEPAATLVLFAPETLPAGEQRVELRFKGVPIKERKISSGATVEVHLPPGQIEVVEFDAQGRAKPARTVNVFSSIKVKLTLGEQ